MSGFRKLNRCVSVIGEVLIGVGVTVTVISGFSLGLLYLGGRSAVLLQSRQGHALLFGTAMMVAGVAFSLGLRRSEDCQC